MCLSFLDLNGLVAIFPQQIEVEESKFTNFKFKPKIPCLVPLALQVPDATAVGIAFCKKKGFMEERDFVFSDQVPKSMSESIRNQKNIRRNLAEKMKTQLYNG